MSRKLLNRKWRGVRATEVLKCYSYMHLFKFGTSEIKRLDGTGLSVPGLNDQTSKCRLVSIIKD